MKKRTMKQKLERRLNNKFKDVTLYKNPNEFTYLYLERVNPDHIGIIWGRRHKKYNKGTRFIKCAKVFFYSLPVIFGLSFAGWFDMFTGYIYNVMLSIGLVTLTFACIVTAIYYIFPLLMPIKKKSSEAEYVVFR